MGPFSDLVRVATRSVDRAPERGGVSDGSKLGLLLQLLDRNGPMTTRELAEGCGGLTTRLVWGLLKGPLYRGQVVNWPTDGTWELAKDYQPSNVIKAAELLRSLGWRVDVPIAGVRPCVP